MDPAELAVNFRHASKGDSFNVDNLCLPPSGRARGTC